MRAGHVQPDSGAADVRQLRRRHVSRRGTRHILQAVHGRQLLRAGRCRRAALCGWLVFERAVTSQRKLVHAMPCRLGVLDWLDSALAVPARLVQRRRWLSDVRLVSRRQVHVELGQHGVHRLPGGRAVRRRLERPAAVPSRDARQRVACIHVEPGRVHHVPSRHELPGRVCGAGRVFAGHVWCEREQRDVCAVPWWQVHVVVEAHCVHRLPEWLALRGGLFCAAAVSWWQTRQRVGAHAAGSGWA